MPHRGNHQLVTPGLGRRPTGADMRFIRREAVIEDLRRIVEIYNLAVATRESSCDLEPIAVAARERWFATHNGSRRPIWVAEDSDAPHRGVVGYLGFYYFMNERPGYYITSDLAIYLRLGTYLLGEAIREAPTLGIEVLAVTIFASNEPSLRLFELDIERDLVMMGRRLTERPAAADRDG
jgi:L-amino acid N-acyltransferase YncA